MPQPGAGEVAIAVSACAVNFPDSLVVQVGQNAIERAARPPYYCCRQGNTHAHTQ